MTEQDLLSIGSIVLLCLLIPVAVLVGRHNIKRYRQRLLEDLESTYERAVTGEAGRRAAAESDKLVLIEADAPAPAAPRASIRLVPSFEMARYKYDLTEETERHRKGVVYDLAIYAMPLLIYVLLATLGFYTLAVLAKEPAHWQARSFILLGLNPWNDAAVEYQIGTAVMTSTAFVGAYIWSVVYLLRRIANYDLSPLSFLRVSTQILLACFTVAALRHVIHALGPASDAVTGAVGLAAGSDADPARLGTIWVGLAFLMGFVPTLGIEYLADYFPKLRLKRNDPAAAEMSRNLPLDMIDGIDTFIKFRLAEMEIVDCQNLATANPVLLFVESPYGLFEIVDWVAQAQLVLALGPAKARRLRSLAIRTVFDLEFAAREPAWRSRLAPILLDEAAPGEDGPQAVETVIAAIGTNLHVQRLRQVWNAVLTVVTTAPPVGPWLPVFKEAA
jgi:hypothetical protein